jgi:hypothetical protein
VFEGRSMHKLELERGQSGLTTKQCILPVTMA